MPPFILESQTCRDQDFYRQFPPDLRHLHAQPACPHVVPLWQLVAQFRQVRESLIPLLACLGTGVCVGCRQEPNPPGQSRRQRCWRPRAAVLPKGMTPAAAMMEGRATRVWLPCSTLLTRPAWESFKPWCFVTWAQCTQASPAAPCVPLSPCIPVLGGRIGTGEQGKLGGMPLLLHFSWKLL